MSNRPSYDPAIVNRRSVSNGPYMAPPTLLLGKVIASHPDTGTVDVAIDGAGGQGGIYANVPVMSWSMGTQTGSSYFPSVNLTAPIPVPNGTYDQPLPSGKQDVWCVIGHLSDRSQRPVVLGFLNPLESQVRSNTIGDQVEVHESGVYQVITESGHLEVHMPDGSYIIVSADTNPANMTQKNANWSPKTTATPYNVTVNVNGSVTINAPKVYLGTSDGAGEAVARVGDAVNLTTGVITGGSSKVFAG